MCYDNGKLDNKPNRRVEMFEGVFSLDHSVKLYVPSTIDGDKPSPSDKIARAIDNVVESFSSWFGGATTNIAAGGWYSAELRKVIYEEIRIVNSFCTIEALEEHYTEVLALAQALKHEFSQEAISIECDGKLYLI
jgi:hypothetical protein